LEWLRKPPTEHLAFIVLKRHFYVGRLKTGTPHYQLTRGVWTDAETALSFAWSAGVS
jgi:hypothetical protein